MNEQLERIKIKQALFKEQKRLFEEKINNQEEFERYMNSLRMDENCAFMSGIREIISLCNKPEYKCRFRGNEYYSMGHAPKFECQRQNKLRFEKILGKANQ